MKELVDTKKLRTGKRLDIGIFEPTASKETIMAMRTLLVSATLESGKLVVDKIWGGNPDIDAAKKAIDTCAKVLQIDDSWHSATWYGSLLGDRDQKGYRFKEWRSQGLGYVTELEQRLIELKSEGSDSQAIILGLREMTRIHDHFAKAQWDDFKARWNEWDHAGALDNDSMTIQALQDEKTVWSEMTGTSDPQTVVSDLEKTFLSILDETIASFLSQATTAATQANSKDQ